MNESLYLAGWEACFNGDAQCEAFIQTQAVSKELAYSISPAIELVFVQGSLAEAFDLDRGVRSPRSLDDDEIGLALSAPMEHELLEFIANPEGPHQLGGGIPDGLKLPESGCATSFQYLGRISRSDEAFSWLPHDLDLICPIYLNFDRLFIDYTDRAMPVVINIEEVAEAESSFEEVGPNSAIVFGIRPFSFVRSIGPVVKGGAGVPNWIQYPSIPRCPLSGRVMRFVCQLSGGAEVVSSDVIPLEPHSLSYFEEMNFWGDGELFVFFDPTSKIACYFIQNT